MAPMPHHTSVLLVALVALVALPASIPPIAAQPAQAQDRIPRGHGEPCPNSEFTCIRLTVPLDHFGSARRSARSLARETIEVVFGMLPATDAARRKGMFVTVVGGPGASGLQAADAYAATFDPALRRVFDLVFFDLRGVGRSGGFNCPLAASRYYQTEGRSKTPAQEQALVAAARTFMEACLAALPATERLQFYTTRQAVEDLEALRRFIGDERIWLYGESYGTQFAQWYAAAHGEHVAGLILDGAVDLTLSGIEFARDTTRAFNDVLLATLRACNAVPACRRDTGGDAVRAYDRLAARLDRAPAEVAFPLPDGRSDQRTFGYSDLETTAAGLLYSEAERMLLQRVLASAARGDLVPLVRAFYQSVGLDPLTLAPLLSPAYSDAIYYVFTCNDYRYFDGPSDVRAQAFLAAGDRVDRTVPRMNSVFYGDLPCVFWPHDHTAPRFEPARLARIPTLILAATADPATPHRQARAIFSRSRAAHLITTRGGAHVTFNRGNDCPDALVIRWLVEGKPPDRAETYCAGVVATDYIPLAPADARAFGDAREAMHALETELVNLPEYFYWDGEGEVAVGCTYGGSARFMSREAPAAVMFTFTDCAFSRGFAVTGTGRYEAQDDRFAMQVRVGGERSGALDYLRESDRVRVTGRLDDEPVEIR